MIYLLLYIYAKNQRVSCYSYIVCIYVKKKNDNKTSD